MSERLDIAAVRTETSASEAAKGLKMVVEDQKQQQLQVRVGELLLQAGILSSEYIKNALQNFEQRGLPIGKVLIMSGYLTEHQLRTALEVQSLVNDGLLPLDIGVQVLQIAHREKISLAEAFQQSGFVQPEDQQTNKLGQLLVGAGIINAKDLEDALQTSIRTGLPLGHICCFRGVVSQSMIWTSLLAQQMIRRGMITREMALEALRESLAREVALEALPINQGYHRLPMKPSLRLGELLVQARILTEGQLVDSLHNTLIARKFLGEILIETKIASQDLINAALDVQEMLDNGTTTQVLGGEALLMVRAKGMSLSRAIAEVFAFKERSNRAQMLMEVLTSSGLVALTSVPRDIQECLEVNYNRVQEVCNLLLERELVKEQALYGALRSVYLISEDILSLQRAIMVLDFSLRANISLDQALIELGWTMRTRLRSG